MEKFVTIKRFTYPYEVSVIQGRLETEGIQTFVKDENITTVHPFSSNAIGGIKLQVKESDVEKANAILRSSGYYEEGEGQQIKDESATSPSIINIKIIILIAVLVSVIVLTLFFIFG